MISRTQRPEERVVDAERAATRSISPTPKPEEPEAPKDQEKHGEEATPRTGDDARDFIVEAEEEMARKGPSPWHGLTLDDFDDWA